MRKQSQPSELEHAITSVDHPYCSILLQQEIHTTWTDTHHWISNTCYAQTINYSEMIHIHI